MHHAFWQIIVPFIVGFGLGGAFCAGVCLLDVGGVGSLIVSGDGSLVAECVRFASLFGILSVATHQGLGFVGDR